MHTHKDTHTNAYAHIYIYIYMYIYTCEYIYIYIYIYIHILTHAHKLKGVHRYIFIRDKGTCGGGKEPNIIRTESFSNTPTFLSCHSRRDLYGMATISRLRKLSGHLCNTAVQKYVFFVKKDITIQEVYSSLPSLNRVLNAHIRARTLI